LKVHRYSGASAGGMMPYEFVLKGEKTTVATHFSYGELCGQYPDSFSSFLSAAYEQDHHWRLMASWQTQHYGPQLPQLNDVVYVALTCLTPLPSLEWVHNYTAAGDQATQAFMGTGTYLEMYQGKLCSDGGAASGPDMTPLFHDQLRPQIIINLMKTGARAGMVMAPVNTTEYFNLALKGQDDAVAFLTQGTGEAMSLCPVGASTKGNVCTAGELVV